MIRHAVDVLQKQWVVDIQITVVNRRYNGNHDNDHSRCEYRVEHLEEVEEVRETVRDESHDEIDRSDENLLADHPCRVDDYNYDIVPGQLLLVNSNEVYEFDPACPVILLTPRAKQLVLCLLADTLFELERDPQVLEKLNREVNVEDQEEDQRHVVIKRWLRTE